MSKKHNKNPNCGRRILKGRQINMFYPLGITADQASRIVTGLPLEELDEDIAFVIKQLYEKEGTDYEINKKYKFKSEYELESARVLASLLSLTALTYDMIARLQFESHFMTDRVRIDMANLHSKLDYIIEKIGGSTDDLVRIDSPEAEVPKVICNDGWIDHEATLFRHIQNMARDPMVRQRGNEDQMGPDDSEEDDNSSEDNESSELQIDDVSVGYPSDDNDDEEDPETADDDDDTDDNDQREDKSYRERALEKQFKQMVMKMYNTALKRRIYLNQNKKMSNTLLERWKTVAREKRAKVLEGTMPLDEFQKYLDLDKEKKRKADEK